MKLTLIRHGSTEGNIRGLYYGATDLPITAESAEELKNRALAGGYPKAERYFTSGMKRTEQSFAALYGGIPHEILPDLREINLGEFEMRSYEELRDDPKFAEWCTGDNEKNVCPGGESGEQVTDRALAALLPMIQAGKDVVIITHGGVIGGVLARLRFRKMYARPTWTTPSVIRAIHSFAGVAERSSLKTNGSPITTLRQSPKKVELLESALSAALIMKMPA